MNSHPFANVRFTLFFFTFDRFFKNILISIDTDIECGLPASIVHGSYDLVNGSVGYLSTVIYKCHEGYEMIGRAMLTCDIDERWNGPPPRCEPIECEELPEVHENARIVQINGTTEYGAKAEVVCAPGYKPDGPRFITCLSTGQWSAPLSPCIRGNKRKIS